jgi:hypothetical protein
MALIAALDLFAGAFSFTGLKTEGQGKTLAAVSIIVSFAANLTYAG